MSDLELDAAYVLRDTIAKEIIDFEKLYPEMTVVLKQQHAYVIPAMATIGQLAVEIRGALGHSKATTFTSLKEKD